MLNFLSERLAKMCSTKNSIVLPQKLMTFDYRNLFSSIKVLLLIIFLTKHDIFISYAQKKEKKTVEVENFIKIFSLFAFLLIKFVYHLH